MYIFKFPFMENTVDPHSEFKAFVLASPTITARQSFSVKPLAVLEIVPWTRDFFACLLSTMDKSLHCHHQACCSAF